MKFLADECILGNTVKLLRGLGFEVLTIQELGKASATNGEVLSLAKRHNAILVTTDLDFSDINLYPLGSHEGIIILRPHLETPEAIAEVHLIFTRLLKEQSPSQIEKSLIIVDRNKYRLKRPEE